MGPQGPIGPKGDKGDTGPAGESYEGYSIYRLNEDAWGVFTELQFKDNNGMLRRKVDFSNGTAPYYTTKTVVDYDIDGITVLRTRVYTLSYTNNELISEVLQ